MNSLHSFPFSEPRTLHWRQEGNPKPAALSAGSTTWHAQFITAGEDVGFARWELEWISGQRWLMSRFESDFEYMCQLINSGCSRCRPWNSLWYNHTCRCSFARFSSSFFIACAIPYLVVGNVVDPGGRYIVSEKNTVTELFECLADPKRSPLAVVGIALALISYLWYHKYLLLYPLMI